MVTSVDTNILVDVLDYESPFYETSTDAIESQSMQGLLIISPIVYSELMVFFLQKNEKTIARQELNKFLDSLGIEIRHFSISDYDLAADAWSKFLPLKNVECHKCGTVTRFNCKKCKSAVAWRNHMITDFLIGAHAQNHAEVFLTRDKGYYRKYFKVKVLP